MPYLYAVAAQKHSVTGPELERARRHSVRTPHEIVILTPIRTHLSHINPLLASIKSIQAAGALPLYEAKIANGLNFQIG